MRNRTIEETSRKKSPCKECPHRRLHCHTICEDYREEQEARQLIKERETRDKQRYNLVIATRGGKKDERGQR